MRRLSILVLAAIAVGLFFGPSAAFAQNILGLSVRPTDLLPPGTSRGTADIMTSDHGGYTLDGDLSAAAAVLAFAYYPGSTAWVVWIVGMDGIRHNVGALDENLVLEGVRTDVLIARIFVTAEELADADTPSENRLFEATLRDVEEVDKTAAEGTPEEPATTAPPTATPAAEAGPEELPTTGGTVQDLAVLALVAGALIVVGLRLRAIRI